MKKTAQHLQLVKSNQAQQSAATFNKKAIAFYVAMIVASNGAKADPTGGQFVAGAGSISNAANLTTIHQTSDRAIVNWQSFGSNAGEAIKFVQPNSNAAILNRVVGDLPSNLNGVLEGNGRVYLVNPNGIILGANGVINVNGGFVASTQGISDSAFMQGGALVFTGESTGSIQILGKIKSEQGDIILIAPKTEVKASAELTAGQTIKLVAANEVELSDGKITVKPKTSDAGQISVEGALQAAQVQLESHNNNLGALAINTTGTIRANGTQTNPDGSVTIMAYGEGSNIKVSGNISAQNNEATKEGGRIIVGRDEVTGELAKSDDVSGASFTTNKGFVETSGHYLKTDDVNVSAKDWLLDPSDITISSVTNSNITGTSPADITPNGAAGTSSIVNVSTIQSAINSGTNVTIKTTNANNQTGIGNITLASNLSFTNNSQRDATLSLIADNGIFQNAGITAGGSKQVNVVMTANGKAYSKEVADMSSAERSQSRGIVLSNPGAFQFASVNINGDLTLNGTSYAANGIGVNSLSSVSLTAKNITINGTSDVRTVTGANSNNIAANATGTGVSFSKYYASGVTGMTATTGDITITGTQKGNSGVGLVMGSSENDLPVHSLSAGGKITLKGINESASNASNAVYIWSGLTAKAVGNVSLLAETANAATTAINLYSWVGGGPSGNVTLQSVDSGGNATGDVLIQTNQGGITFNNGKPNTGAVGYETKIVGRNITIDNTGGAVNQAGLFEAGAGKATTGTGINFVDGRAIKATQKLTVVGASSATNGVGINLGSVNLTGGSSGNSGAVTLAAAAGSINTTTSNTPTNTGITQNGNGDVTLTTVGNGNITVPKITNNGTGNVIVAAGSNLNAGDGTGGQVKTLAGNSISNANGKTYIYTGSVANSAKMSDLNSSFNTMALSGNGTQNTASNVAYATNGTRNTIANGANAQVLYREKIKVNLADNSNNNGTNNTLSDGNAVYGSVMRNTLDADGRNAIKNANTNKTLSWTENGNTFSLSSDALIDTLSVNGAAYSSAGKLKASVTAYGTESSTYTTATGSAFPTLTINPKAVAIQAAGNTVTYDGSEKIDGTPPNWGLENGDEVYIVGLGKGIEPGLYASTLALGGGDAANYAPSFTNATLNIQVANRDFNNANTSMSSAYVPLIATNLSPVSFGFAAAGGATAAGVGVEGSCDAWSQRAGAGSVAIVGLLKPSSSALRHAKTDGMDAMTGGQATTSASGNDENPCERAALANKQAGL